MTQQTEKNLFHRLLKALKTSLSLRVVTLSILWVVIALISLSAVSLVFYKRASEQNLERVLTAHLYSLISAVNISTKGVLQGSPELGDIRYSDPQSGWYWEVTAQSSKVQGRLTSPSLGTKRIASPSESEVAFDQKFLRSYQTKGLDGQMLQVIESDVVLDNQNRVARFRIMGNLDEARAELKNFRHTLQLFLWSFGIGSVLINILIIFISMRPLKRIRKALENIVAGKAHHVDLELPVEVIPLAKEMNVLIDNNQRIVERFRTQVGNLAHSLKTPLSVLSNEANKLHGKKAGLVAEQTLAMQAQINHYLQRARIAAQRDSVIYHTPLRDVMERLLRVMAKINPDKNFDLEMQAEEIIFAGEKEDLEEMVGNLLENAAKWSQAKVVLICEEMTDQDDQTMFKICVDDDGQGLSDAQRREAWKRGKRLDETKPGTGLGLSIVADMVNEYGGQMALQKSHLGGLRVTLILPRSRVL